IALMSPFVVDSAAGSACGHLSPIPLVSLSSEDLGSRSEISLSAARPLSGIGARPTCGNGESRLSFGMGIGASAKSISGDQTATTKHPAATAISAPAAKNDVLVDNARSGR